MSTPIRRGAKGILTTEKQDEIVHNISQGAYIDDACEASGIGRSTYYHWLKKGRENKEKIEAGIEPNSEDLKYVEFLDAIKKAEAQSQISHIDNITKHAKDGAWQASAWYLERKYPEKWGRRDKTQITGPNDGPIQITPVPYEELEAKILKMLESEDA